MKSQLWQGDSWAPLMRSGLIPLAASAFVLAVVLNSCGGGDSSGPPPLAAVASVEITPFPSTILVFQTVQLTAVTKDAAGNVLNGRMVTWSQDNGTILAVSSSGLVSTFAVGTTTIRATSEGKSDHASLSVIAPVAKVVISPASASPYVGQTVQLIATTLGPQLDTLTGRTVSWSTSSAATATVSASGLLTAAAAGSALITATSEGQTGSAAVTVFTVTPLGRRTTRDRPDEASGVQVKFVYFTTANGRDIGLDTTGVLDNSVGSAQNWFISKTGKMFRQDTYRGKLDVVYFKSNMTDAQIAATGVDVLHELSRQLTEAGFTDPNKKYLIYYDGTSNLACGVAIPDGMGAVYFAICGKQLVTSPTAPPDYYEFVMLHELIHTRGYVDPKAPDNMTSNPYHVPYQTDLMSGTSSGGQYVDSTGHNYYGDSVPAGVRNLKNDAILIPAPAAMLASARLQAQALREHPQAPIPYPVHDIVPRLPRR